MKMKKSWLVILLISIFTLNITNHASAEIKDTHTHTIQRVNINLRDEGGGSGTSLNLFRFVNKYGVSAASGRAGTYTSGSYTLIRDRAVNSGSGTHGGSYWKLYDRYGKRVGTFDRDGIWLRP
ncbi:hypothetical protein KG091_03670 [Carnobacteriaceae bacterium zg-ZUI78]|nr:hypothetical protein [Carnobacteriaceae bacterium zg-ZUI78]